MVCFQKCMTLVIVHMNNAGALQFSISTPAVTVLPTENYQTPSCKLSTVAGIVINMHNIYDLWLPQLCD